MKPTGDANHDTGSEGQHTATVSLLTLCVSIVICTAIGVAIGIIGGDVVSKKNDSAKLDKLKEQNSEYLQQIENLKAESNQKMQQYDRQQNYAMNKLNDEKADQTKATNSIEEKLQISREETKAANIRLKESEDTIKKLTRDLETLTKEKNSLESTTKDVELAEKEAKKAERYKISKAAYVRIQEYLLTADSPERNKAKDAFEILLEIQKSYENKVNSGSGYVIRAEDALTNRTKLAAVYLIKIGGDYIPPGKDYTLNEAWTASLK